MGHVIDEVGKGINAIGQGVGDLWSDITGQSAAREASRGQERAAQEATSEQRRIYEQQREDITPWRETGMTALDLIKGGMNDFNRDFSTQDFQQDPGYQFRMDEAQKAIERSAAARGGLGSGRTLKDLTRFSQDYASNEYQNAYNRFNADRDRRFNRLASLAGIGQTATGQLGQAAQIYGQQYGQNVTGAANAAAAARIGAYQTAAQLGGQVAGALAFCDERLKTNIQKISKEDIKEFKDSLKGYTFNYKSDLFGKGDWAGVMAQDLQKTKLGRMIVVEDSRGNLMIDTTKAICLLLAIYAESDHAN